MIQVKISTNDLRKTVIVDGNTTIRQVLENNDINYATTQVMLDGTPLQAGQMDNALSEMNVTTNCILSTVVKTSNAI